MELVEIMTTEITVHNPSGKVRGTAAELVVLKGKQKRIAHAFIPVGENVKTVSTDVPKTLSIEELRVVAHRLLAFVEAVETA